MANTCFENVENVALDLTEEQIDRLKKTQIVVIQIGLDRPIEGYDFKSVAEKTTINLVKVDEFDPSEYFLDLSNTWDLSKNLAAVQVGILKRILVVDVSSCLLYTSDAADE